MGESLTQRRRVREDALRGVNRCQGGRTSGAGNGFWLTVPPKEAPANSVPAAAVIRRVRALFGITGRKGRVGGPAKSYGEMPGLNPVHGRRDWGAREMQGRVELEV